MLENKLFNLIIENIDFYILNKRKLKISNLYCLKQIYKVLKTGISWNSLDNNICHGQNIIYLKKYGLN